MADQIRLVTIKRGYDPRQFALLVLGGAGRVSALVEVNCPVIAALSGSAGGPG